MSGGKIKTLVIILMSGILCGQTVGVITFALGAAPSTAVVAGVMAALAVTSTGLSLLTHLDPPHSQ